MRHLRVFIVVVLPFAAAYYASYFFRNIDALISHDLDVDLKLGAAHLGLLTSVYFLAFAFVQIPAGILLDRFGPRRVQSTLLLFAAIGAALFGLASRFEFLLIGRALIGFGVAGSLIAGLKAIALWFPKDRLPLVNGCFIMIGTLGVISATVQAEWLLHFIGWKTLFVSLAGLCVACALAIFIVVPEAPSVKPTTKARSIQYKMIYADARFWRLAPLSMMCISTAWALQGLWAASWFFDVEGLEHPAIVRRLFVMAISLSFGALLFGVVADQLRGRGVRPRTILCCIAIIFILAQIALVLDIPISSFLIWPIIASTGAATVISYSVLSEYFPIEILGQANSALNTFHIGGTFVIQAAIGLIVGLWTGEGGHYPAIADRTALGVNLAIQVLALGWFIAPRTRMIELIASRSSSKPTSVDETALAGEVT